MIIDVTLVIDWTDREIMIPNSSQNAISTAAACLDGLVALMLVGMSPFARMIAIVDLNSPDDANGNDVMSSSEDSCCCVGV